jgi:hypothetical protein
MGQDVGTGTRLGYHALANRGFNSANPPPDLDAEIESIVAEFIGLWTDGLAQAGIDPDRIYTHVAFLTRAKYDEFVAEGLIDPAVIPYETMVNSQRSTQHPSVAFAANSRPGFSTYPGVGQFDQIQEERALHGFPAWASAEGTNSLGGAPGDTGITMETYLARCFNHGATLVDVFGWGIGGTYVTNNPYRLATEDPDALEAYRKFLNGQTLAEEGVTPPVFQSAVSRKTHGTAGDFDIALNTEPGFESIECRSGGSAGACALVFAFDQAVESAQASVVSGAGSIAADSPAFDPESQTVGVDLTGVTSGQKITVRLSDLGGIAGQTAEISLRLLAGDTNGDRRVNIADTAQTQSRSGQTTGAANFRSDVNGDDKINIADTAFIRSQSGKSVP